MTTVLLYAVTLPVILGGVAKLETVSTVPAPSVDWIAQRYLDNPIASILHILPGLIFLAIGPLQFAPFVRNNYRKLHRMMGRLFIISGFISAVAVIWMVFIFPAIGGALTQIATTGANLLMIAFLWDAWRNARAKRFARHRSSMIRAYAIGLSVSTARIFIHAGEWLFDLPFEASFTGASMIGVTLNIAVAEWVIRRRTAQPAP
ncbi:MAG: DUF2306 domain-containing protein [Sulfitobacter sp.]